MNRASEAFDRAIPLGRKLGDAQFVRFAEVYFAETHLACGRLGEAIRNLRWTGKHTHGADPPILRRMVHVRLLVAESLLGRPRAAESSSGALEASPRTDISLPEAWNDVFLALAVMLSGGHDAMKTASEDPAAELFHRAFLTFDRLSIPNGARIAQVGLLYQALRRGDTPGLRAVLKVIESSGDPGHRFLSVLEPMARAEASLFLGELERAKDCLEEAGGAIVGLPYLELDWRIEFLRARLAERQGDREGARRYLHRGLHSRDLLAQSLPPRLRQRFLSQPRFAEVVHLAARLEKPRITPLGTGVGRETGCFHGMIGRSPPMMRVFKTIEQLRDQEIPVLITGETGTGKELVARAIHQTGPRRRGSFFALHCASLPPELFESELFGYEAGAFTGADASRSGLLEHMAGGTLLLDEISSLSLSTQSKLLRVLDSRTVRPLGGLSARPVDVRFLASSSVDIEALVSAGTFRADLYFRLMGVGIHLPPLRARKEDISALSHHFLSAHARRLDRSPPLLTSDGLDFLQGQDWLGNVRELEATLLRALVTCSPGAPFGKETLRRLMPRREEDAPFSEDLVAGRDLKELKRKLERVYLTRLFRETRGDPRKMMKILGVKRSSLYDWFQKLGINLATLRGELS